MQTENLQLVLPSELHETYLSEQQDWLLTMDDFLNLVEGSNKTEHFTSKCFTPNSQQYHQKLSSGLIY